MKKMLLTAAVLATIAGSAQVPAREIKARPAKVAEAFSLKYEQPARQTAAASSGPDAGAESAPSLSQGSREKKLPPASSWQVITQSMNVYGNVENNVDPLQYNDELQLVSFVHRKSPTYIPRPFPASNAQTGVIVGVFTYDWGSLWDTTLLWNNDTYWGRYPQGGIYLPPGLCDYTDGYLVASGPVTGALGGWDGSYFASKQLDIMGGSGNNDTMSTNLNGSTFIGNTGSFPYGKFDYPSLDFAATDDGMVRSLGFLANDINGTANTFGWQGASIVQGTFLSGGFAWMADTIIPDIYINSAGTQYVIGEPHMAWNESGSVGFLWFVGVRNPRPGQGDTLSNMGYQPIVYKTVNSGASWTELPRIDFNDPAFSPVMNQIFAVQGDSMGIPFFNTDEWMDCTVDQNNRLHIVSTVYGTFSKNPDSLNFFYVLTHEDGEQYNFRHIPGLRPFIFDFTETPTGWQVTVVDSMGTEAPGTSPGDAGVNDNPWDATGGATADQKVDNGARIQLSRTPDGQFIIYTFAESDTGFTTQGRKWNSLPNVKARLAQIGPESGTTPGSISIHSLEINITKPANVSEPPFTIHNQVADRATMHHVSPKMARTGNTSFGLPITVTNNSFVPMQQLNTVNHYYLSANLKFESGDLVLWPQKGICISVAEGTEKAGAKLYPNPTIEKTVISYFSAGGKTEVNVLDASGRRVIDKTVTSSPGMNDTELFTGELTKGIYLIVVKTPATILTTKLIVE